MTDAGESRLITGSDVVVVGISGRLSGIITVDSERVEDDYRIVRGSMLLSGGNSISNGTYIIDRRSVVS